MYGIGLVQQCLFLDSCLGTTVTAGILLRDTHLSHLEAETHSSTSLASRVNWLRIWEATRDRGLYWTTIAQSFYRLLTTPLFGDRTCWKCSDVIPPSLSFIDHLTLSHCINSIDLNDLLSTLGSDSDLSHSLSHPFHCMKVIVSSYRAALTYAALW